MTLSELIVTRISHDLAGICGALYNTAELLEIDKTFADDAGPLMKQTAASMTARLKFFRAIFGLKTKQIEDALAVDYFKTLSAPFTLTGHVTTPMQLGAVLVCCDAMIRGGEIHVSDHEVVGRGPIKADAMLAEVLKGTAETDSPKLAPAAWLAGECQADVTLTDHEIRLKIG